MVVKERTLSPARQQKIKELANTVSENNSLWLLDICKKHAIKVSMVDFDKDNKLWLWKDTSWVFLYNIKKDEKYIIANKNHPVGRVKFTIAHELWHFFLHEQYWRTESWFIDTESSLSMMYRMEEFSDDERIREREANCFAANLLMPEELIKKAFRKKTDNIIYLAEGFGVSTTAMSIRLKNLWLIS